MPVHTVAHLGNSTFILRPDYDATVAELGYEPPMGLPVECTFEWAWDAAEQKVTRERRAAARREAQAKRKAPAKKAVARRNGNGASEATPAK